MWSAGDRFVARPVRIDAIVDLRGGFVVSPYAEGHNHWIEPALVDTHIQVHLREGIFYVKDQLTAASFHDQMRGALDRPSSVDYIRAHRRRLETLAFDTSSDRIAAIYTVRNPDKLRHIA